MYETKDTIMQLQATIGDPFGAGYGAIHATIEDQAEAEALRQDVEAHIVVVSPDAPSACIDGRAAVACLDGSQTEPRPGVAGGGLISAYAAAELVGWFAQDAGTSTERLSIVHDRLVAQGLPTGAHCDSASSETGFASGKTGCGADDRLPEILQVLHENKPAVDMLTGVVLGSAIDTALTNYTDATTLGQRHEQWRPTDMVAEISQRESARHVEVLASDQTPTHGHTEQAVVFNNVEDTTVDRDALFSDTNKQVFDVDVWYLRKIATAMASGPDAVAQENALLHALVAYQVATYLTLCDGSQRPIFVNAA